MKRSWLWLFASVVSFGPRGRAEDPAPSFDPETATPYFASGSAAEARRRFAVEDWAGSASAFDVYLKAHPKAADRAQAEFMAAYATSKAGRFADAADRFDGLAQRAPLLADYDHLYAARALTAQKRFDAALERARLVDPASPLDAEARFTRADALRQLNRFADAEREYRAYVEKFPGSWREPEARFRLGQTLEALAKNATHVETASAPAREQYRFVFIHFPTESWARESESRLQAIDKSALDLKGPEHLARGMALFDAMRNAESEAELRLARAGALDAVQQCTAAYHLAQSVFKARERARAAPLFDEAVTLCKKAPRDSVAAADLHAKSLYQGGRCHGNKDELAASLRCYAQIEAEHPTHSYADDARLRSAEILDGAAERLKNLATRPAPPELRAEIASLAPEAPKGATPEQLAAILEAREKKLLSEIPDRYPAGDQGGEALFRLAFHALEAGNADEAKRWLDKELAAYPREQGWWEAGRTLYWLGRVADRQARPDEAKERYARSAREYPLSYYALSALNRLRERFPDEEKRLVAELELPAATQHDLRWTFPPHPLFGEAGFRRGVELARLGLGGEAKREFAALGIKAPEHRGAKVESDAAEQLLWLAAVLYDRAGEYALSHFIPRHVLTAYSKRWPVGDNKKRWLLSYPHGYRDLVVEQATKNGQPVALQFAIIREESAFDPGDESFANAVGLTQLTQAPAKRFAQGLPYSREALKDPVINVTIGARELGDLWKRTHAAAALTIAGYNAGDGAVRRWLKASPPGIQLDEFVERIPYDETRGYTKRVLSSYFVYHWLYESGDPVPPLAQSLGALSGN